MARLNYQVLVLPYHTSTEHVEAGKVLYAVFRRKDSAIWQFIAGGGETGDTSILMSAQREAYEEAGIPLDAQYVQLETTCSIASECFNDAAVQWGKTCLVVKEYSFAVPVQNMNLTLSDEHTEYLWADYETAKSLLKYDSNRVALWELHNKLQMHLL